MAEKFAALSESEKAVCSRFREARKDAGVTQARIARHVGLSRDQVASVEAGRVALRFWPAWRFCAELDINALWLAHGSTWENLHPFVDYGKGWAVIDENFAGNNEVTFFDAFRVVEPVYRQLYRARRLPDPEKKLATPVHVDLSTQKREVERLINAWLTDVPPEKRDAFVAHLGTAAKQFYRPSTREDNAAKPDERKASRPSKK